MKSEFIGENKKRKKTSSVRSPLEKARETILKFFKTLPEVKRVNITRVIQMEGERKLWEAEAEVFVPNATIEALDLPIQKAILDLKHYWLRLDEDFNVLAFEVKSFREE